MKKKQKNRYPGRVQSGCGQTFKWLSDHVNYRGDECLIWPFARSSNGYGSLTYKSKGNTPHRLMCEMAHGESPLMLATHSCGNGHLGCVNPRHLRWETRSENAADMVTHGTHRRGEKHYACKLNSEAVREIRSLLGTESQRKIAKQYEVSRSSIADIANGKTWRWL